MRRCLLPRNEGRYDFGRHADGPSQRFVDNCPLGSGANADFPVCTREFHKSIRSRALWRIADLIRAYRAGRIDGYYDVIAMSK